ncbi:MAG: tetratricopeptide repeat-containing glycosyltransferase family protein [Gammaproteobacteria bacterium]|nr:tetratricopeptide repeat-containing glycosyltransferase family protein [Gammaproteobacteria bacterium]
MSNTDLYKEQITKAINQFSQKKFNEAEEICLRILSENNNPDANHIIGCIRMSEGKFDESISYITKSLDVNPEDIGALISLGCALSSKKDYKESIKVFKKIINLKNDISQVHFYLGEAYRQVQKFEESLAAFKQCLSITPDHIGCQLMVGIIYEELKKFDQAISFYKSCIETYPDYVEPHINLGMCLLLTGNYDEGWSEYEWRLKLPAEVYKLKFAKPKWIGQDLSNKKLLIVAEQSIGETFQYIRFAKHLAIEGAEITVMAQPETSKILEDQKWIKNVISYEDAAEYDYYTYLLSIPKVLEWSPKMDTQKHPYISINGDIADKVINTKKNIGIMISGDKSASNYKQITVPQDQLQSVFKNSGHNLIDLNSIDDFYALSEVVKDLDLVISIESDLVHLAGSLNIPTWVMLPVVPKHTWDLNYKETTPWYSSVELFRQESRGNWSGVIKRIEERLSNV